MNYLIIVLLSYSLGFLNQKSILMGEQLPLISIDIKDDYILGLFLSLWFGLQKRKRKGKLVKKNIFSSNKVSLTEDTMEKQSITWN